MSAVGGGRPLRQSGRTSPVSSVPMCRSRHRVKQAARIHWNPRSPELGLIRPIGKRDGFRFVRGRKPSLGQGVFSYAVTRFWRDHLPNARTLAFEALAHEPGSPGRVFLLDENDLVDRLTTLEDVSNGQYRWSETTGLKQLIRNRDLDDNEAIGFIEYDYDGKMADKDVS